MVADVYNTDCEQSSRQEALIVPVIMSGGSGTRLWPLSTEGKPKQFHALMSEHSMLQETVLRTSPDRGQNFLPPVVICSRDHRKIVEAQLQEIGRAPAAIVLEPVPRNTAAVAVVAASLVETMYPDAFVLLAPADHVIADASTFRTAVHQGLQVAKDRIVTFGIEPTAPETGYGYIHRASRLTDGVYEIARFTEKPSEAKAKALLAEGGYDWNAGIFLFAPATLLGEMAARRPDILEPATAALRTAVRDGVVVDLDARLFATTPSDSLDLAVMERTRKAAVVPCQPGWADVGSWSELWRLSPRDADDNVVNGRAVALDSSGSLIWGDDVTVGVIGVTDLIVVASQGAVVVLPKSRAQEVKGLLGRLKAPSLPARPPAAAELLAAKTRLERWLVEDALPLWARAGIDPSLGGFYEAIRLDGTPEVTNRRVRVQTRQIYVYATAIKLGWGGPSKLGLWEVAVRSGLNVLQTRYRRPDCLVRAALRPDGSAADDKALLYDQAFALFSLAAAAWISVDAPRLRDEAVTLLGALKRTFAHNNGGFREASVHRPFQSNPQMHLFEAALAWSELDPLGPWSALADGLAELALTHLIDAETGVLREYFDAQWRPAPGDDGRIVEPGHQFEWAWLLARWGKLHGRDDAVQVAERLFRIGVEAGVDQKRGVAINGILDNLQTLDCSARLWPQTERIKAALILADLAENPADCEELWAQAVAAVQGLELYLQTPTPGLWRDKLDVNGHFLDEPAPASSFYHIVGAVAELFARMPSI